MFYIFILKIFYYTYTLLKGLMKTNIHPNYIKIKVTCSCGKCTYIFSTLCKDINIDVCFKCHPFYTGQQRLSDTGGRIEKFNKKFKFITY